MLAKSGDLFCNESNEGEVGNLGPPKYLLYLNQRIKPSPHTKWSDKAMGYFVDVIRTVMSVTKSTGFAT